VASIHDILLRVTGADEGASQTVEEVGAKLEAFAAKDYEAALGVDATLAEAKLDEAKTKLEEFARETAEAKVDLDTERARVELDRLETALREYGATHADANADVNIAEALAKIALLKHELSSIESGSTGRSLEQDIQGIVGAFANLAGEAGQVTQGVEQVGQEATTAGASMGSFGAVMPLVVVGVVALVAALVPAALALTAIGIAGIAALGPIVALAAVAVASVVSGGQKAKQAATAYESALQGVASAQQQVVSAEQGVADAQRNANRAQTALTSARQQAALTIRTNLTQALDQLHAAEEGVTTAEQTLTNAQIQARNAEQQLTIARRQARQALVDERLAAEGANLSHKDAVIALAQAQQQLQHLENQRDRGVKNGPTALDIRAARQAVADAEFQVRQTRVASNRAQQDLNTSEQQGVDGAPAVVAARQAIADANQSVLNAQQGILDANHNLAEAQSAVTRAEAASVRNAPSVVAARQRVADATRAIARAEQNVRQQQAALATAQGKLSVAATAKQQAQTVGASFYTAFMRIIGQLQRALGPAIRPILSGMGQALGSFVTLLNRIHGPLSRLGEAIGASFGWWAREIQKPFWVRFFSLLANQAANIMPPLTRLFGALARIFAQVVTAALPFFVRYLREGARWLSHIASDKDAVKDIRQFIRDALPTLASLVRLFASFVKLIVALGKLLGPVFTFFADKVSGVFGPLADLFDFLSPILKILIKIFNWADAVLSKLKEFSPGGLVSHIPIVGGPLSNLPIPGFGGLARGVTGWRGGPVVIGEEGPELVDLPRGADVFPANITRAFLAAISGRISAAGAAFTGGLSGHFDMPHLASGTGAGMVINNNTQLGGLHVSAPGASTAPDPRATVAAISRGLRARGIELAT
jgi:hypothetical protein